MILILGSIELYQVARVCERLTSIGRDFTFVDFNDANVKTIELDDIGGFRFLMNGQDVGAVTLAWRATKFLYRMFGDSPEWAEQYINGSMQRMNYHNFLSVFPGRVVNPICAIYLSSHKLLQLKIARDTGFMTPRSVITNCLKTINEWKKKDTDLIIKCIDEATVPLIDNGVKQRTIVTSKLSIEELKLRGDTLEPFQVFVQENIIKKFEHRCVFVADKIFNFRIDPSQHPIMETDYRQGGMMVNYVPHELPEKIAQMIFAYAKTTDLFSGCFDLVEDICGNYIFLEVNPEGIWGKHDDILDGAISSHLANTLTRMSMSLE